MLSTLTIAIAQGIKKRKVLTIDEKLNVIEKTKEPGATFRTVAREFGIGISTVFGINKQKEALFKFAAERDINGAKASNRKTLKPAKYKNVDEAVFKWFSERRAQGLMVSGDQIIVAAEKLADSLGVSEFKCSAGWLQRFKDRHCIYFRRVPGQTGYCCNTESIPVQPCKRKLDNIMEPEVLKKCTVGKDGLKTSLETTQPITECQKAVKSGVTCGDRVSKPNVSEAECRNMGADVSEDSEICIDNDLIEVKDEPLEHEECAAKDVRAGEKGKMKAPSPRDNEGERKTKGKDWPCINSDSVDVLHKMSSCGQMRSRQVQVDKSTIRTSKKERDIRQATTVKTLSSDEKSLGGECFREMERALYLWIKDQQKKNIPVNGTIICKKATKIQAGIDKKMGASGTSFYASYGWLSSFKKRHGLHIVTQEISADTGSAEAPSRPNHTYTLFHPITNLTSTPSTYYPTTSHTSTSSHPATKHTGLLSCPIKNHIGSSSHPAANHVGSSSHPAANHIGSSSLPAANHIGSSSLPATNHIGSSSLPAGNHIGSSSLPAANHIGSSSLPAANHIGSSSLPAANHIGSSSLPAANHIGSSSLPAANHIGSSSLPAANHIGSSSLPAANHIGSSSLPAANHIGSSSLPAANHIGSSSLPAANHIGSSPLPAANHIGSSSLPAANHIGSSSLPAANHIGSSSLPAANHIGSSSLPAANHIGSSSLPAANHNDSSSLSTAAGSPSCLTGNYTSSSARPALNHTGSSSRTPVDHNATVLYAAEFAAIIKEEGYSPEQVFNAGETGLFWKRLPSKTFLMEEEKATLGFKASKDRLSLLFCSNAAGDFKLPPVLGIPVPPSSCAQECHPSACGMAS
ncbi:uncharacterized protein [Procambarus clarkii]|uniref:uncharacterized protein n=1 Tax=Procambarus clarkii TaxID=6728 RepID=UPI003742F8C7